MAIIDSISFFAAFTYLVSSIFLLPFFGISPHFPNKIQPGTPIFDSTAFMAIFCYSILILLASALTHLLAKIVKTDEQVNETIKKDKIINPREVEDQIR